MFGLEAIFRNGVPVGHLRRADYGFYIDKTIGYGYIRNPDGGVVIIFFYDRRIRSKNDIAFSFSVLPFFRLVSISPRSKSSPSSGEPRFRQEWRVHLGEDGSDVQGQGPPQISV